MIEGRALPIIQARNVPQMLPQIVVKICPTVPRSLIDGNDVWTPIVVVLCTNGTLIIGQV